MNPCLKTRGLSLACNPSRGLFPQDIRTETIGTMTDAFWKLAQHFYMARPLVATTRNVAPVQAVARRFQRVPKHVPILPQPLKNGKEVAGGSDAHTPNKDSAFLPAHECGGLLPRFGEAYMYHGWDAA